MEECYSLVLRYVKWAAEWQKRQTDLQVIQNKYTVGDLVYIRNLHQKKMELAWQGPWVFTRCIGDCVFKVHHQTKSQVLHHDQLKLCVAVPIPAWTHKLQKKVRD